MSNEEDSVNPFSRTPRWKSSRGGGSKRGTGSSKWGNVQSSVQVTPTPRMMKIHQDATPQQPVQSSMFDTTPVSNMSSVVTELTAAQDELLAAAVVGPHKQKGGASGGASRQKKGDGQAVDNGSNKKNKPPMAKKFIIPAIIIAATVIAIAVVAVIIFVIRWKHKKLPAAGGGPPPVLPAPPPGSSLHKDLLPTFVPAPTTAATTAAAPAQHNSSTSKQDGTSRPQHGGDQQHRSDPQSNKTGLQQQQPVTVEHGVTVEDGIPGEATTPADEEEDHIRQREQQQLLELEEEKQKQILLLTKQAEEQRRKSARGLMQSHLRQSKSSGDDAVQDGESGATGSRAEEVSRGSFDDDTREEATPPLEEPASRVSISDLHNDTKHGAGKRKSIPSSLEDEKTQEQPEEDEQPTTDDYAENARVTGSYLRTLARRMDRLAASESAGGERSGNLLRDQGGEEELALEEGEIVDEEEQPSVTDEEALAADEIGTVEYHSNKLAN